VKGSSRSISTSVAVLEAIIMLSFKLGQTVTETHDMLETVYRNEAVFLREPSNGLKESDRSSKTLKLTQISGGCQPPEIQQHLRKLVKWWPRDRRMTLKLVEDQVHINGRRFVRLFLKTWECGWSVRSLFCSVQRMKRDHTVTPFEDFVQTCQTATHLFNCIVSVDEPYVSAVSRK
jgi:hypothetical protein